MTNAIVWGIYADYIPDKGIGLIGLTTNIGRILNGSLVPLGYNTFLNATGTFSILSIL